MRNRINQLLNNPEWNALCRTMLKPPFLMCCPNNWNATSIANLIETAQKLNIKIEEI